MIDTLHRILLAVVKQLKERGGVLNEDAAYWLLDLEKATERGGDIEARLALAEEKIEFLAERIGLVEPPAEETPSDDAPDDEPEPEPEPE
jgi:hypothetical protein